MNLNSRLKLVMGKLFNVPDPQFFPPVIGGKSYPFLMLKEITEIRQMGLSVLTVSGL